MNESCTCSVVQKQVTTQKQNFTDQDHVLRKPTQSLICTHLRFPAIRGRRDISINTQVVVFGFCNHGIHRGLRTSSTVVRRAGVKTTVVENWVFFVRHGHTVTELERFQ